MNKKHLDRPMARKNDLLDQRFLETSNLTITKIYRKFYAYKIIKSLFILL